MESDRITTIGHSVIQHGYFNDRIYLMKIHPADVKKILLFIAGLRAVFLYTKIVIKIPKSLQLLFHTKNTVHEATIPDFYPSGEDALFLSRFYNPSRASDERFQEKNIAMHMSLEEKKSAAADRDLPYLVIRKATPDDIDSICALYQKTFETYPFPIQDPEYVLSIMKKDVRFFVGEIERTIVAAGSCEIDREASAVEMTDLAIDNNFRGYGISKKLLETMEREMKLEKIRTAYTICRSMPIPVNRLFAGRQYLFGGTLVNNTNICGSLESMNVWYKRLT